MTVKHGLSNLKINFLSQLLRKGFLEVLVIAFYTTSEMKELGFLLMYKYLHEHRTDYTMSTRWIVPEYLNKCFGIFPEEDDQWADHCKNDRKS